VGLPPLDAGSVDRAGGVLILANPTIAVFADGFDGAPAGVGDIPR
jgi:hypothetical protein